MADTIDVPKIGSVKKSQLFAIGGIGGGIVLYAWWRARSAVVSDEVAPEPEDPYLGLTNSGGGGAVGGYTTPDSSSDTRTTAPRTNAEWSQLAAEKLAASYEPQVIDAALGRFLGRQPLTTLDQEVVRAAIARAGNPPEGTYSVISGGDTALTVAPAGLKVAPSSVTAVVSWSAVPGATSYLLYRNDQATSSPQTVTGTSLTMYNLTPGREYKVWVKGVTASGKQGPASTTVIFKTTAPVLKAPTGLKAVKIERTQVTVTFKGVPGADGYVGFQSGAYVGTASSNTTTMVFGGLKAAATYTFQVAGRTGVGNAVGPKSASIKVKTKK